jgi:hypothetical protein
MMTLTLDCVTGLELKLLVFVDDTRLEHACQFSYTPRVLGSPPRLTRGVLLLACGSL